MEGKPCCQFHPREVVVGVCAICLKERLLALVAKQGNNASTAHQRSFRDLAVFPKVFALSLTTSFLHHRQKKSDEESVASLEESFISMKFEDDGKALWDEKDNAVHHSNRGGRGEDIGKGAVVEHRGGVRWKKRVDDLFQVLQWNRSSKPRSCHATVEVADGATVKKRRRSWMRSLTTKTARRRRT